MNYQDKPESFSWKLYNFEALLYFYYLCLINYDMDVLQKLFVLLLLYVTKIGSTYKDNFVNGISLLFWSYSERVR